MIRYTGVGNRYIPDEVYRRIFNISNRLDKLGLLLATGDAIGSDHAFASGSSHKEIFHPTWYTGIMTDSSHIITDPKVLDEMRRIAKEYHPGWNGLSFKVRELHARNVPQVLGKNLDTPSKFLLCYTRDGATKTTTKDTGGTGQAIRVAVAHDIPVINLRNEGSLYELKDLLLSHGVINEPIPHIV